MVLNWQSLPLPIPPTLPPTSPPSPDLSKNPTWSLLSMWLIHSIQPQFSQIPIPSDVPLSLPFTTIYCIILLFSGSPLDIDAQMLPCTTGYFCPSFSSAAKQQRGQRYLDKNLSNLTGEISIFLTFPALSTTDKHHHSFPTHKYNANGSLNWLNISKNLFCSCQPWTMLQGKHICW